MLILKFYATNGSLVWSRTWDGGHGYDEVDGLAVDGNGLFVSGWIAGATTQNDVTVLRYDVNGTLMWSRSWGSEGWDEANGQLGIDENYVYVVGRYDASSRVSGGSALLVAFNKTDGNYAWNVTWSGATMTDAFGMVVDSKFIYSVGIMSGSSGDGMFLLKYSRAGVLVWNATWSGSGSELTRSVGLDANSTFIYVAGSTTSVGNGNFDVVLLKYDQSGTLMFAKTWGGSGLDRSHAIVVDDPFVYVAGDTWSYGSGGEDAFLFKVDTEGENVIPEFNPAAISAVLVLLTVFCVSFRIRKKPKLQHL
jgi:hypothetical protein